MTVVQITLTDEQMDAACIASLQDARNNLKCIHSLDLTDEDKALVEAFDKVLDHYGVKPE